MRRASSKLLFHIPKLHTNQTLLSLISRDFPSSIDIYPHRPSKPLFNKYQSLLFPYLDCNGFWPGAAHNFNTLAGSISPDGPQLPSRQRKIEEKSNLVQAFASAESVDEMLEALKSLETCVEEKRLGLAYLKIGFKLDQQGEDPERALSFAQRALKIFDDNSNENSEGVFLTIAFTLRLLGQISFRLKRFNESLGYYNRAVRVLNSNSSNCYDEQILPNLHSTQHELFMVKTAMCSHEEAIDHLKKYLEITEKMFDENSKELGDANRGMAKAYIAVSNFQEALPFCSKALDIHKTQLGHDSVEVAYDRSLLGIIYTGLDEHEKALEQNQLSRQVLKNWGRSTDLLQAEIDAANIQLALGRHEQAIETLENIVQQTEKESEDRAMVFTSMAKVLCSLKKVTESKKCLEIACKILEKKEKDSPKVVTDAFMEISMQYETMKEFGPAIFLLKKTLTMLEKLPHEQHLVGHVSARIGRLLLLTAKVEEAIPFLEDAAERLKVTYGSKHLGVGYVYNNLGTAYLELGKPQSAAQVFAYAKEIMEMAFCPHHVDAIEACQNLSKAYAAMGSYPLAINFQENVVEGLEGHQPSAQDKLEEAVKVLEQLKEKASAEFSEVLLKAFPSPDEVEAFLAYNYFNTIASPISPDGPQLPSSQRKIKEKSNLVQSFVSAKSVDEMLEALKSLETCVEEKYLGLACLKIGSKLDEQGEDPEKALFFAQRALKIFDDNSSENSERLSFTIAMTLKLLGSISFSLNRFNDSLGYLNRASSVLSSNSSNFDDEQILPILHAIQFRLSIVKTALGCREEAIAHLKMALEIKEKMFDENSIELGEANRDMAEAYVHDLNFKEALPFCSKALDINITQLGHNSEEVAYDRRLLGVIYTGLGEHEKALEQNQLSHQVLKNWGRSTDLLRAEIDAASMQIDLGQYEQAIETLKNIVQQTEKWSEDRAMVFTSMAKALCSLEKFTDSKKCLKISCKILEKREKDSPEAVIDMFMEISKQYETMNEFGPAIFLLKKTLTMLEKLPREQHSVGFVSESIGRLLLLTAKVEEAIPFLEDAAERLKESFGSNHFVVGYVYKYLGAAYLELGRPQSAVQVFAYAKEIMDVARGPHHVDAIEACQNLSKAYAAMGSYPLAINFQEKVVEGLEGHGPSAQDELDEAVKVLEQLKEKASADVSEVLLKACPLPEEDEAFSANNNSSPADNRL